MMERIRLGRTGAMVSSFGLGGIQFSKITQTEVTRTIRRALELGVNFLETAHGYFDSEGKIGAAMEGRWAGMVLATKTGPGEPKTVMEHLHESLRRLRTEYIHLYQMHGVDREEGHASARRCMEDALLDAKADGKIGAVGVTTHSLDLAMKMVEDDVFDSIQLPISFINQEVVERGLIEAAAQRDVGLIAMKPLGGGRLGDPRLCLGYIYELKNVVPVVGVETPEQVEQLVHITEHPQTLTEADRRRMQEIEAEVGKYFCRACNYCQPCPEEIPIYRVLYFPVYIKQMGVERVLSSGTVQVVQDSERCVECGECEERCPFGLSIVAGLKRSRKMLAELR